MTTSPSQHKTEDKQYALTEKLIKKINEIAEQFPEKGSALLPSLHVIQDEFGWVPYKAVRQLADILEIAPNKIYGVLTFYTMFNTEPVGKFHIQICRNISCSLMGSKNIVEHVSNKLHIEPGETTKDGEFSLSLVECLGACGSAPVMMINDTYHENLTEEKVDKILESLQ